MERDEEPLSILDMELRKFILENTEEEPIILVNSLMMAQMMMTPNMIVYNDKKLTYKYRDVEVILDKKININLDADYEIMTMKEYKRRKKGEKRE